MAFLRRRSTAAVTSDPTLTWRPLPRQHSFLASVHPRRLLRAGNQWGKTTAGAVDLIEHITGGPLEDAGWASRWCPARTTPEPIEAWVVCASWSQSVVIQRKIYELLPKHLLHPSTVFDEVRGFRGKNPAFRIRHASGGWSIVRIKTMGQGGLRLASATIQYAWFDEPPESPRIYSEITKRVMRAGSLGRVIITMTPVNADVEWIRTAVVDGQIEDHHARMEPDEFVPMIPAGDGSWVLGTEPLRLLDGTACDAIWIAAQIRDTLPHEIPVVCHGEWRMTSDAPVFPSFRLTDHVGPTTPRGLVELVLGIDHGVRSYTQVAVLCAVSRGAGPDDPDEIWVLDEYVGEVETTEEDDARGILEMLDRRGIKWADLDFVHGDRSHAGSGRGATVSGKSNARLAKAIARNPNAKRHGIRAELHPPIGRAKQGVSNRAGSVEFGCAYLHRCMVRGKFHVHPRCTHGITAILGYDGTSNSSESHWVDALRYGLRASIWRYGGTRGAATMHVAV